MKRLLLSLLIIFLFVSVFAQPAKEKAIEADFDKIFQKMGDLDSKKNSDENSFGLLSDQSNIIINKLQYYTDKYPSAMDKAFKKIGGISSEDGQFRIFLWDTMTGGTQHYFENVIQYRSGSKMVSFVDSVTDQNYVYSYDKLFTLKIGTKSYYLATYYGIFGLHERGEGIRIFAIENGKVNNKVNLIKTKQHITYKLYYTYDQTLTNSDIMSEITLEYDPKLRTITFPVISENGEPTDDVITYKFTGQYFEKVKN